MNVLYFKSWNIDFDMSVFIYLLNMNTVSLYTQKREKKKKILML